VLRDYAPLKYQRLQPASGYAQPTQLVPERVGLDDPALQVMTDFKAVTAVIVLSGDPLDEAHHRMIQRGVRLLLVIDQDRRVVGVITASDILGERPLQVTAQRSMRRQELLAKVGHIVATLRHSGRQHALVVEHDGKGRQTVRGVFSATQIARQLGVTLTTSEIARTFSEIEAQLVR
jgi:CBS-domain-containing membrane protein